MAKPSSPPRQQAVEDFNACTSTSNVSRRAPKKRETTFREWAVNNQIGRVNALGFMDKIADTLGCRGLLDDLVDPFRRPQSLSDRPIIHNALFPTIVLSARNGSVQHRLG